MHLFFDDSMRLKTRILWVAEGVAEGYHNGGGGPLSPARPRHQFQFCALVQPDIGVLHGTYIPCVRRPQMKKGSLAAFTWP